MTVPDEAVEAAARCQYEREWSTRWEDARPSVRRGFLEDARAALTAAAPFIAAQATVDVTALIDEAENRHGSSMYCKVTTYELRKSLGQDVSDWPNGGKQ